MGRKISHKHTGPFIDQWGCLRDEHEYVYRYADGKKWIIKEKYGVRYLYTIWYYQCSDFAVRIPTDKKDRSYIKEELQKEIDKCFKFLEGNPLSGSYNNKLRNLLEVQGKYFSNSIDFITTE